MLRVSNIQLMRIIIFFFKYQDCKFFYLHYTQKFDEILFAIFVVLMLKNAGSSPEFVQNQFIKIIYKFEAFIKCFKKHTNMICYWNVQWNESNSDCALRFVWLTIEVLRQAEKISEIFVLNLIEVNMRVKIEALE